MKTLKLISYGRWYYDHASTMLPCLTTEDGKRSDWGKVEIALENGLEVKIKPATDTEHAAMAMWFDEVVDDMSKSFVYGIGNFEADNPPPDVAEIVKNLKLEARTRREVMN